jgi:hypothetical protein
MTDSARPWPYAPDQSTPAVTTEADYLCHLHNRREDALARGDSALVADCEERIVRYEVFLARLTSWDVACACRRSSRPTRWEDEEGPGAAVRQGQAASW